MEVGVGLWGPGGALTRARISRPGGVPHPAFGVLTGQLNYGLANLTVSIFKREVLRHVTFLIGKKVGLGVCENMAGVCG